MRNDGERCEVDTALRSHGAHMLRRDRPGRGKRAVDVLVGLGVFPIRFHARGQLGNGMCGDPRCPEVATRWAAWIYQGQIVVLPFCEAHAAEKLRVDEEGEVLEQVQQRRAARAERKRGGS